MNLTALVECQTTTTDAKSVSGVKTREIARILTRDRIPTPSAIWLQRGTLPKGREVADEWISGTISKILRNPAYCGKHTGFTTKVEMVGQRNPITHEVHEVRRLVPREADDPDMVRYDESVCPPLIDEGTFNAVKEVKRRNKEEASRNLREPESLLLRNGFAKCGYCGRNLVGGWSISGKHYRYSCFGRKERPKCLGGAFSWRASYLDDIVWRWFMAQFEDPEIIRAKYALWKADRVAGRSIEHDRLAAIDKALMDATRRRKNYLANSGNAETDAERLEYAGLAHEEHKASRAYPKNTKP